VTVLLAARQLRSGRRSRNHHDQRRRRGPWTDLLSGLDHCGREAAFLFAVPGLAGVSEGKADGALADRVVAYDAGWAINPACPLPRSHRLRVRAICFQLHTLAAP